MRGKRAAYRKAVLILLFSGLFLYTGGCGSTQKAAVEQPEEQIVIWTWDETFNIKAARMAALEYQKERPDLEIVIETKEREEILADTQNILAARVYEKLPDIIMLEDYDVQQVLALYEDEFVDLTARMSYDHFVDYKKELCSRNGRMYGIPFDSGTAALFYRADILAEAGYTEEDMRNLTWEAYIRIGEEVYRKTGIPMLTLDPTDLPLVRLIMQSCGSWYVDQEGNKADIAQNKALKQALLIYRELLETEIGVSVNGWNEFISAFQNGEVATILSGSWIISSIKEKEEQAGLWRVTTIPVVSENPDAVEASNVGGSAWYVLKNSAGSQAAAEFLVKMLGENDAFSDSLITEIGIVPAVKDPEVFENYETADPFFGGQQVTKLLTELTARIPTVNYGSKTYEIEDILEEEFQHALTDGDLDQCLKRVQMKAEAVVKE